VSHESRLTVFATLETISDLRGMIGVIDFATAVAVQRWQFRRELV
jgi:hypothetical protein